MSRGHWITLALLGVYALSALYIAARLVVALPFFFVLLPLSTLAFFGFAFLHAGLTLGWPRAWTFLGVTWAVTTVLEGVGVSTGWVYGPYAYTERLGPKLLGLVPVYIPLAWFMMGYTAYTLVAPLATALGLRAGWKADVWTAATGALAMAAWDLTMDPIMVSGNHWVWQVQGAYFGIPIHNYAGWLFTAFTFYLLYQRLVRRVRTARPQAPVHWWPSLPLVAYVIAGTVNFATLAVRGIPGPIVAGFFGMAPFVLVGLALWGRKVT